MPCSSGQSPLSNPDQQLPHLSLLKDQVFWSAVGNVQVAFFDLGRNFSLTDTLAGAWWVFSPFRQQLTSDGKVQVATI